MLRLERSAGLRPRLPTPPAQRIGRAAIAALYDELALAPKPGLVSFVDAGSHTDMDARSFMRSLFALRHYFPRIAMLGQEGAPFARLQALGQAAETRMLQATGGINTHRGAVFSLGLLCAAAGRLDGPPPSAAQLRRTLMQQWGEALRRRCPSRPLDGASAAPLSPPSSLSPLSHGQRAIRAHGLRGAGEEAAQGFPVLFEHAVPALLRARRQGLAEPAARLQTFFEIMAVLDDTNLAHRGGMAGLRHARAQAWDFLAAGGAARPDALAHARSLHADFVARRLSPGGSADLLAAALLVGRLCRDA